MLLKHSASYLVAIGLPGVINLLAITVYTRMLSPQAYGEYALVLASTGLLNAILFRWVHLGLLRFYSSHANEAQVFLSTVMAAYLVMLTLSAVGGILGFFSMQGSGLELLLVLGAALLWMQAFFELNKELARSQFRRKRYGFFAFTRALLSLCVSVVLIYAGYEAAGLLVGLLVGMAAPVVWVFFREWRIVRLQFIDAKIFRELLTYGLPLTGVYALAFVVNSSDRLLLGWLLDTEAAGLYSVGYDFAKHALGIVLMVVNLASYPLAVSALENHGIEEANKQLADTIILLLAVSLPATAGLMILAPNISQVFLGESFRQSATELMPWIAGGALLAGIKAYYCDLSFQLGRYTMGQVWVALVAAAVNVILNFWFIPVFGVIGAAYSTVAAFAIGIVLSLVWGRRSYLLPWPIVEMTKVAVATLGMSVALLPLMEMRGVAGLCLQIICGVMIFVLLVLSLNIRNARVHVAKAIAWTRR